MRSRGGGAVVADRPASRPHAWDAFAVTDAGIVAAALLAWAGHACSPVSSPTRIHPDSRVGLRQPWRIALRLGVDRP